MSSKEIMQAPIGWTDHLKGGVVFFLFLSTKTHTHSHKGSLSLSLSLSFFFLFISPLHTVLSAVFATPTHRSVSSNASEAIWRIYILEVSQDVTLTENIRRGLLLPHKPTVLNVLFFSSAGSQTSSTTPDTLTHWFILKLRSKA